MSQKIKIAIFASGNGSNAENIITYFNNHPSIAISIVLSNKADAYVLQRTSKHGIKTRVFGRDEFYNSSAILEELKDDNIDYIVLAGFLWLIPESLITHFPNRIINIHPALLPKHGGKGMYGMHVHEAVVAQHDKETGITIHLVNSRYDEGRVLFQAKTPVSPEDTADEVAAKIHTLEMTYFPKTIEQLLLKPESLE